MKLVIYYEKFGVALEHILIANQTRCEQCGCESRPFPSEAKTIIVYTSLSVEPTVGTIMPSRCVSRGKCGLRGRYGWDVLRSNKKDSKIFRPQTNRHKLTYWVISTKTAFLTEMIEKEIFPQVLWNHAASLNLANQGNYLLGHYSKILH